MGFREHFDTHHLIILQLQGSKTWQVSPSPERFSSKLVSTKQQQSPSGVDRIVFALKPGDALYVPRGCWHRAHPGQEGSTHLSFGVHIPSIGEDLIANAKKAALELRFQEDSYGFDVRQTDKHG